MRRMGVAPYSLRLLRWAASLPGAELPARIPIVRRFAGRGLRLTPTALVDLLLRAGPYGDLFGLRRGGLWGPANPVSVS